MLYGGVRHFDTSKVGISHHYLHSRCFKAWFVYHQEKEDKCLTLRKSQVFVQYTIADEYNINTWQYSSIRNKHDQFSWDLARHSLTRFNTIAIQGTPHMAVD